MAECSLFCIPICIRPRVRCLSSTPVESRLREARRFVKPLASHPMFLVDMADRRFLMQDSAGHLKILSDPCIIAYVSISTDHDVDNALQTARPERSARPISPGKCSTQKGQPPKAVAGMPPSMAGQTCR